MRSLLADLTAAAAHLTRSLAATAAPESAAKRGVDAGAEETQPKRAKKIAEDDAAAAVDVEAAAVDVDEAPALDPPEVAAAPTRRRDGRRAPIDLAAFEAFRRERDG